MRIRTRLFMLALAPVLLVVVVGVVAFLAARNLDEANELSRIAQAIENRAFGLAVLAHDYVQHREERAQVQWQAQYAGLARALDEAAEIDFARETIDRIRRRHVQLGRSFAALLASSGEPPGGTTVRIEEWESRLAAQLLIEGQAIFTDAGQLTRSAQDRMEREQIYFLSTSLVAVLLVGAFVGALALRTARSIASSLRRLHVAADRLAAGDLNYHADTGTRDEHGQLAAALNDMARKQRDTQQQLIQSEKLSALGTLAAGVAHELNNPMMGVLAYIDYVRRLHPGEEAEQLLASARQELERMRDLLRSMLAFARPIEEKITQVRLARVLERAAKLVAPELKIAGVALVLDVGGDLPDVSAKEQHLQQVFLNLLMNARDAVEAAPVKRIAITARRCDAAACIDVADTGQGVPVEIQGRIFDPFFTTKPPGRGTGLGLSISKTIITDIGGTLSCRSRPGEGAVFTVRLPAATEEAALGPGRAAHSAQTHQA